MKLTPHKRNTIAWLSYWAVFILLDIFADKKKSSLSNTGRHLFRTDKKVGKIVFLFAWGGFNIWFVPHICKEPYGLSITIDVDSTS